MKPRILVADDDASIRELLRVTLEQEGYSVLEARDGEDCLTIARNQRPHLILLDIMMPGSSGDAVCRALKERPLTRHIPVVFVSVKSRITDLVDGFSRGADDYISKPFNPAEVVSRLQAVQKRYHLLHNPDTSLPTTVLLLEELHLLADAGAPFILLPIRIRQLDLLERGGEEELAKEFLHLVADMLFKVVGHNGTEEDSLWHLTRDTFLIVTLHSDPAVLQNQASAIYSRFRQVYLGRLGVPEHDPASSEALALATGSLPYRPDRPIEELLDACRQVVAETET